MSSTSHSWITVESFTLPDYVCVCRSPAGMIEGTPQLHANAWKVSSACVTPVNLPIVDPCEMNQNNGNNGFNFFLILDVLFIFTLKGQFTRK